MPIEHETSFDAIQTPHDGLPGEGHAHTNRLIESTSPYLLQHAHNPVDWHPWGAEALEKARREEKPIFLSIGYAACHWCHVMEREVFEKPAIAEIMNEHFVNIKVDREERPDLDELYMLATQLMTGHGGWPMSVWLTPELEPFYAGTYFPPEDGHGRPGFVRLERALADAWQNRRGELREQAARVVEAIRLHADESGVGEHLTVGVAQQTEGWVRTAIEQMADRFDDVNGGLGGAPKFPPHQALELWLAVVGNGDTEGILSAADQRVLAYKVTRTLDGMMNGGIYDQVGGGFARYSTDDRWLVPHFEKMLYDSAQLAPVYAVASVVMGRPEYARVACETLDFFLREMTPGPGGMGLRDISGGGGGGGGFYSSLDADSEGVEGKYYVWTVADVRAAVAAKEDQDLVIEHFGLTDGGNWEETPVEGASVLAVAKPVEVLAEERGVAVGSVRARLDGALRQMRAFRDHRPRPGLDDKILTSWNGLMVSALAVAGRVLHEPRYLEAAHRLIGFLLTHHMEGGRRLLRVSRAGKAHTDAFLDDHACLLNGLMDLIDSTTPTSLPGTMARKRALELADVMIRDFQDAAHGGFYFTGPRHEQLFSRMKNAADNATPSANAVAIRALLRLAQVSGKEQYREAALRAVAAFAENIGKRPEYFSTILLALLEDEQMTRRRAGGAVPGSLTMGIPLAEVMPGRISAGAGEAGLLKLTVPAVGPVKAGGVFEVVLQMTVPTDYHVQAAEPADREAFKTIARVRPASSSAVGDAVIVSQEWTYPPARKIDGGMGYVGNVEMRARCMLGPGARAGEHVLRATVVAQPCSGTACLPPERVSVEFSLHVQG